MEQKAHTVVHHADPFVRGLLMLTLIVLLIISVCSPSQAQGYQKSNKRYHKAHYRKERSKLAKACHILERKRYKKPRKPMFAFGRRSKPKPMAEVTSNTTTARATESKPQPGPAPAPKKYPVKPKVEQVSDEKLVTLHKNEDEVLARNNLPVPTSTEHERMRKRVKDKIDSKTNIYPLDLAPLYFNFDEDEFSVVDMEPFLMAAEYALQGRTVLIEGHTDNKGADDYNVQLSIKRVQKIRQLMLDMGVPDDRISIVGYGEEIGTHSNSSTEGRQMNRRVDFTIF